MVPLNISPEYMKNSDRQDPLEMSLETSSLSSCPLVVESVLSTSAAFEESSDKTSSEVLERDTNTVEEDPIDTYPASWFDTEAESSDDHSSSPSLPSPSPVSSQDLLSQYPELEDHPWLLGYLTKMIAISQENGFDYPVA